VHASSTRVAGELAYEAPDEVHDALAAMGRTEDLRFSPDGRRLAFACYGTNRVAVASVDLDADRIALTRLVYLESELLRDPHGIDFLDDETIVVGNRDGGVEAFRIDPDAERLERIGCAGDSSGLVESPGSVAGRALEAGGHELLACNNWADTITRHPLVAERSAASGEVVARRWLYLPDGLALSHDGRLLAVSNHNAHAVFVYEYPTAGEDAEPIGILRGISYPHGLRFVDDGRRLLVADAGAPYLHAFVSDGDWRGVRLPAATLQVVDDETFARGRSNPAEGGPKGLDVHGVAGVVAITLEELPLAFFELDAVFGPELPHGFEELAVRYELLALSEAEQRVAQAEARAASARAALSAVLETKAWKATAPMRRLRALLPSRRSA
jgi:hypothetical protein